MIIEAEKFKEILDTLKPCCAKTDKRPVLTFINLKVQNGEAKFQSTNSFILKGIVFDCERNEEFEINFKPFECKLLKGSIVEINDKCIKYTDKQGTTITREHHEYEQYPDTSRLINDVDVPLVEFGLPVDNLKKLIAGMSDTEYVRFKIHNPIKPVIITTQKYKGIILPVRIV